MYKSTVNIETAFIQYFWLLWGLLVCEWWSFVEKSRGVFREDLNGISQITAPRLGKNTLMQWMQRFYVIKCFRFVD